MKVLPSYTNENYNWTISSSNILLKLIVVTFKYVILFLDTAQYPWTILYLIPALQLSQAHTHVAKAGPVHRSPVHAGFQSIVYFSKQSTYIRTGKGLMVYMANLYKAKPALVTTPIKNLLNPSHLSPLLIPQSLPPLLSINWRRLLDEVDCWMRLAAVTAAWRVHSRNKYSMKIPKRCMSSCAVWNVLSGGGPIESIHAKWRWYDPLICRHGIHCCALNNGRL